MNYKMTGKPNTRYGFFDTTLQRIARGSLLAMLVACAPGCVSAVSVGVNIVGGVVDRVDVDDLEEKLVGADVATADAELGQRIDQLNDIYGERMWLEYPARSDPLGKDRYVIEVKGGKVVAVARVEKTPDAKFDIPRALLLESKVKGKPISECEALLDMGPPLVTVRRTSTGLLSQLYEGDLIKVGDPVYCILIFNHEERCKDVEFHGVGAATTNKTF